MAVAGMPPAKEAIPPLRGNGEFRDRLCRLADAMAMDHSEIIRAALMAPCPQLLPIRGTSQGRADAARAAKRGQRRHGRGGPFCALLPVPPLSSAGPRPEVPE